ncbi:MAG: thiamine diphosphokinase [Ignavibacterium sp.]|jgi:thiamine pyrophosphokinase|nr:thiamine diphosphokinase [Ignavibacterium sp.]
MKRCLILANGKSPAKKTIEYFHKKGFTTIICADGGANSARKLNLIPDFIIGDLDSITDSNLKYYSKRVKVIRYNRQDDTDVDKSIKFAIKNKFSQVVLSGVTGDRLDHTICNLGIVIKYLSRINIYTAAEKSFLIPVNNTIRFPSIPGEIISIYAFDKKTKVTSAGLKYKLNNSSLAFGVNESTSNVSVDSNVTIEVKNGVAFVIRELQSLIKYDLFQFV